MRNVTSPPIVFRNNAAVAAWVVMGVWLAMLGLFTYVFVRDWNGEFTWLGFALAGFWVFGLAGARWVFALPRVRVEISRGGVGAREMFLWSGREDWFALAQVSVSDVVEGKDSDGDPYFKCSLQLPGNRSLTIAQSHQRADVEATRARLLEALGRR